MKKIMTVQMFAVFDRILLTQNYYTCMILTSCMKTSGRGGKKKS